nr:hypothetical protein [Thermus sediminis]
MEENPSLEVEIDLVNKEVRFGDRVAPLSIRGRPGRPSPRGFGTPLGSF